MSTLSVPFIDLLILLYSLYSILGWALRPLANPNIGKRFVPLQADDVQPPAPMLSTSNLERLVEDFLTFFDDG